MLRSRPIAASLPVVLAAGLAFAGGAPPPANLERALAAQEALVASPEAGAATWNDLGNLLALAGRAEEAEAAYRKATELSPEDPTARFNLGLLFLDAGRLGKAADQFEAVLAVDRSSAWAHYQLGVIALSRGSRGAAVDRFARAFALDATLSFFENNPHVLDNPLMTEALLRSKRYQELADTQPARRYGQPGRIAGLLLQQRGEAAAQARETSPSAPSAGAVVAGEAPPGAEGEAEAKTRQLTSRDVRRGGGGGGYSTGGSAAGGEVEAERAGRAAGVVRSTPGRTSGTPQAPAQDYGLLDPRGRPVQPTAPGGALVPPAAGPVTPPPVPGTRYRPSRRSTASLEIELLPPPGEATGLAG